MYHCKIFLFSDRTNIESEQENHEITNSISTLTEQCSVLENFLENKAVPVHQQRN